MKRQSLLYILSILAFLILISCSGNDPSTSASDDVHLGSASLEVTCNDDALPHFNEGFLLLHSFEYMDAGEAFERAQQVDPNCAMAYWGEAMTKHHTLWRAQYTEEAVEILERFGPDRETRLSRVPEGLERDLFEGAEILFGEGEKKDRDKAYAEHMAGLYDKYPGHHEVAAFYAISLLGSATEGRDEELYGKGAIIAQGIIKENPRHPGALHYLIHSYDDPDHAHLALDAANSYSRVAPDAGHALHMPSHIYIALGMWDEVISSNIAAWEAGNSRVERKGLGHDERNYHALQWLMYGYLQKGEMEKAREQLDLMMHYGPLSDSKRARAYMAMMRSAYLVDAAEWDDELAAVKIEDEDLNVSVRCLNDFIDGMVAYRDSDAQALQTIITHMQAERKEEEKRMMQRGAAMCSGVGAAGQLPNQQDINVAHIIEMELQALHAMLADDPHQAEMWFNKAVALDDVTSFMFGPPSVVKPVTEMYGEWLMARNMPDQAVAQFDKTLERAPKRRLASQHKSSLGAVGSAETL